MTRQEEIFDAFAVFHRANPGIWRSILARVRELRVRGASRIAIRLVVEQIRAEAGRVNAEDVDAFKVNNNFNAWYARLVLAARPELDGVIECRRQRSALRSATGRPDGRDEQLPLSELQADPFAGRLLELLEPF